MIKKHQMNNQKNINDNQKHPNRLKSFIKHTFIIINVCLSSFYFGYTMGYFGTIDIKILKQIFGITIETTVAQGLLSGCTAVGAGFGAFFSFFLFKFFSRRNCFLIVNLVALIAGSLVMIKSQITLIIFRTIQGICIGFYTAIVPVYIKQITPTELTGLFGTFNQAFIGFGVFFAFLLEYILKLTIGNPYDFWYIIFGFTLITTLTQTIILLFIFPYETPKYLILIQKQKQAQSLVRKIYKEQFILQVLSEKKNDVQKAINHQNQTKQQKNIDQINQQFNINSQDTQQQQVIIKTYKKNKIGFYLGLHLNVLQQFSAMNLVVMYGPPIMSEVFPSLKQIVPIVINLEKCIASIIASFLLIRFGRKSLIMIGTVASSSCLFLVSIGFFFKQTDSQVVQYIGNILIVVSFLTMFANYGLTIGTIVWLYTAEIVEPHLIAYTTTINWTASSMIIILFPIITQRLPNKNPAPMFIFFAVWSALSLIINRKYLIETKGNTQSQIRDKFNKLHLQKINNQLDKSNNDLL